MLDSIKALYRANFIRPKGTYYLIGSFLKHGTNLLAMLRFATKLNGDRSAFQYKGKAITYNEFYQTTIRITAKYQSILKESRIKRIAFYNRNSPDFVSNFIAASSLNLDVFFINVEVSNDHLKKILSTRKIDILVTDDEYYNKLNIIHDYVIKLSDFESAEVEKLKGRYKSGKLTVLTGGSSGKVKYAERKPSITSMLFPFIALLKELELYKFRKVIIPVPIYHGYGLAAVTMSIVLGSEITLTKKFNAQQTCELITKNKIDVAILVPTMIRRIIDHDKNCLSQLHRVLTGGAPIYKEEILLILKNYGNVLFNLYGTSEAGFCVLATSEDLKIKPETVGKAIKGVNLKIVDDNFNEVTKGNVGQLAIRSAWSIQSKSKFVLTGDTGKVDENGYVYLVGRNDDMIVSGGENVYPFEIKQALMQIKGIKEVEVIPVDDPDFGKRFRAFVEIQPEIKLSEIEILSQLKLLLARFQMPDRIVLINSIPYLENGKLNRKKLLQSTFYN